MNNIDDLQLLDNAKANGVQIGRIMHKHLSVEGQIEVVDEILMRIDKNRYGVAHSLFQNLDYGILEGMLNEMKRKNG